MSKTIDPFSVPMIFCRIGWMNQYDGLSGGDGILNGGKFVKAHGYGHEIFNFRESKGKVYGYCQPSGGGVNSAASGIQIRRLGADRNATSLVGVTVVWVATHSNGGEYVVGWYKNATVFRNWQPAPSGEMRRHNDEDFGFYISANSQDAKLLPILKRSLKLPKLQKGRFGQSNVWYALDPDIHAQWRMDVLEFIGAEGTISPKPTLLPAGAIQTDLFIRQEVEKAAIKLTTEYFIELKFTVKSFEKDQVGWDLEATRDSQLLRLEVKGLSGHNAVAELTPNEFAKMQKFKETYCVCIVTNALQDPTLQVFAYSPDSARWESEKGKVLDVCEVVAARCTVK
jgi:hypothetical protein